MNTIQHRLRQLAQEAQQYQTERGWSDSRLCKEFGQLGSTKTYKRILDPEDALDDLSVENQLTNYEAALEMIRLRRSSDAAPEPEYDDFSNVQDSIRAVQRALKEESIARFVVIEGENGTGKDAVKNNILRRWDKICTPVEASELWKESAAIPLLDIIQAMDTRRRTDEDSGEKFKVPTYPQARLELIIAELGKRRGILLINEAHHIGPRGINLIKTIINRTQTVVVFLCIPSLLSRLMKSAYEECVQLFGNRLCERVRLKSPPAGEILPLMERRGVTFADTATATAAARSIAEDAANFGNWRYVVQVSRELRAKAAGQPVTLEIFARAKTLVISRRVPSRYTREA